jgi:hypothetical protein
MPKVTGPLLSINAQGKLANRLIYKNRAGEHYVTKQHYPKKEPSLDQWTQRHIMGLLTAQWHCMSSVDKAFWEAEAKAKNPKLPGYHYFMSIAQTDLHTYHGLELYYPMNEASGNIIHDYFGLHRDATGYPATPGKGPLVTQSFQNNYGNARWFGGNDCLVTQPFKLPSINNSFTLSCWLKCDIVAHYQCICFFFGNYIDNPSFALYRAISSDYLFFEYYDGIHDIVRGALTYFTNYNNTYLYFTFSFDYLTGTSYFYRNANLLISHSSLFDVSPFINVSPQFIGSLANYASYFNGTIDEFRIYNRLLSSQEILQQYNLLRLDKTRSPKKDL